MTVKDRGPLRVVDVTDGKEEPLEYSTIDAAYNKGTGKGRVAIRSYSKDGELKSESESCVSGGRNGKYWIDAKTFPFSSPVSSPVAKDIADRGYLPQFNNAITSIEDNGKGPVVMHVGVTSIGILKPKKHLLGFQRKPIHVGTLWLEDKKKKADIDNWVLEVCKKDFSDSLEELSKALETKYTVAIRVEQSTI